MLYHAARIATIIVMSPIIAFGIDQAVRSVMTNWIWAAFCLGCSAVMFTGAAGYIVGYQPEKL